MTEKAWRQAYEGQVFIGTAGTTAATQIIYLMSRAMDRIPAWNGIRPAFYMNRTVFSMLRIQALNKSQNAISIRDAVNQFGVAAKWADFLGVPLRKVDQLLNTESRVV